MMFNNFKCSIFYAKKYQQILNASLTVLFLAVQKTCKYHLDDAILKSSTDTHKKIIVHVYSYLCVKSIQKLPAKVNPLNCAAPLGGFVVVVQLRFVHRSSHTSSFKFLKAKDTKYVLLNHREMYIK